MSLDNDLEAFAAEFFVAKECGQEWDAESRLAGDGGCDFRLHGLTVDVVHMGFDKSGHPRMNGHVIINPDASSRWADIYIAVAGSLGFGYTILGWTLHEPVTREKFDFGFGPKWALPTYKLRPIDELLDPAASADVLLREADSANHRD